MIRRLIRTLCASTLFVLFFGSALSATAASTTYKLLPIVVSGTSATITIEIDNGVPTTNYYVQGGKVFQGSGCTPDPTLLSNGQLITPGTDANKSATITYTIPNMAIGSQYCVGIATRTDLTSINPTIQELFADTFSSDYSVGAVPATPEAPVNDCGSAGNGCYHLLAPLPGVGDANGNVDVSTGFGPYAKSIIRLIIGLIGVLSVLMIVVGGIEYMTTVQVGEKASSKNRIVNALFGLLLAVSSYIILNTINPNLVNLNITVPSATLTLASDVFTPTSGGGTFTGGGGGSNVTKNITTYDQLLAAASTRYGFECTMAKAVMYAESGGNPNASSGVASGLMQLTPATFKTLNSGSATNPADSIDAGVHYLSMLKTTACNNATSNSVCNVSDSKYIIAAYNGGPKANALSDTTCKPKGITTTSWQCTYNSGYQETRDYVTKVQGNYTKLKANGWGC